jgi:vesicle-associated membrane protein 7
MSLLFSAVARHTDVLARHATAVANFDEITSMVLARIDEGVSEAREATTSKMTIRSGDYSYHYDRDEVGVVYLCISDEEFDRSVAFALLGRIRSKFENMFTARHVAVAVPMAMNGAFADVLATEMKRSQQEAENRIARSATAEGNPDKIERLREEVRQVKDVMVANIDALVDRGERLDLLVDKTEQLSSESVSFRQSSRALQRKMWWQNTRMKVILVVAAIVILYAIVTASCGGFAWPKCINKGGN